MNAFILATIYLAASVTIGDEKSVVLAVHEGPLAPVAASQWRIQETPNAEPGSDYFVCPHCHAAVRARGSYAQAGTGCNAIYVIETEPPPIERASGWAAIPPEWLQASGLFLMTMGVVALWRIDRGRIW